MIDLAALPRSVMPAEFFELARAAAASEPAPAGASAEKAVVHLLGAGGGSWSVGFEGGRLRIDEGTTAGAPVQLTLSVGDWREVVAGRVRDLVRSHAGETLLDPRGLGRLYAHAEKVERLKGFRGDLRFVLEDPAEDAEYAATVTLGGGEPRHDAPATTVRIGLDDLGRILSGQENVQSAFFGGKIRLDGDMNLAMGLLTSLMAQGA